MENQFNKSPTVGQLFDKAVDKLMNDQKFRSNMEQKSNCHSWSSGGSQVIEMGFLLLANQIVHF